MKDLIEELLKNKRKKRGKLAEALGITYVGLQHKMMYDTFTDDDLKILESFFDVEKDYFENKKTEINDNPEQSVWQFAKEQLEKRVEELSTALNDARYTIQLQRKMLEQNPFKFVSKKPPVRIINYSFMYVSHISPTPVLNIG